MHNCFKNSLFYAFNLLFVKVRYLIQFGAGHVLKSDIAYTSIRNDFLYMLVFNLFFFKEIELV